MKNRYFRNYISLLFVIIMLFSGMCQELNLADSPFMFQNTQQASIRSVDTFTDSFLICTDDLLAKHPVLTLLDRGRRGQDNLRSGTGFYYRLMTALPNRLTAASSVVHKPFCNKRLNITIIMHYIHHQDGEKSKSFI